MKLLLPALFVSVGSAFVIPSSQDPVSSSLKVASDLFVDETRASVSKYYGEELKGSVDLKTNACCTGVSPPKYIQECINNIHPEVVAKYYGCGLCLPQYPLDGATVLDLGSGSGRDVYIASQLVGPTGKVSRKRCLCRWNQSIIWIDSITGWKWIYFILSIVSLGVLISLTFPLLIFSIP